MDEGGEASLKCLYLTKAQETCVRNFPFLNKLILLKEENTPTEMWRSLMVWIFPDFHSSFMLHHHFCGVFFHVSNLRKVSNTNCSGVA